MLARCFWTLCAAWLCLFSACRTLPATQVLVFFHGDATSVARAVQFRVRVFDGSDALVLDRTDALVPSTVGAFARVPLVPRDGDASRRFRIEGTLRDDRGVELSVVSASAGYVEHELRELHLWFDADCAGIRCADDQTCQAGTCVGSCFEAQAAGETRSAAACGECELCNAGACVPRTGGCGSCVGDMCVGGVCEPQDHAIDIFAGETHSCAQLRGDSVHGRQEGIYCWGSYDDGTQMRVGGPRLEIPGAALRGSAGDVHTCAVDPFGTWTCFGQNTRGELGSGVTTATSGRNSGATDPMLDDVDSGAAFTCGVQEGSAYCWGLTQFQEVRPGLDGMSAFVPTPTRIASPAGINFASVVAEGQHACALSTAGQIYCWGLNTSGELGRGERSMGGEAVPSLACTSSACPRAWSAVAGGAFHMCAVTDAGELWCWGGNRSRQVGTGIFEEGVCSEAVEENVFMPRRPVEGGPYRTTSGSFGGGRQSTCAITMEGRIRCWGNNEEGQLGTGNVSPTACPTEVVTPSALPFRQLGLGATHGCAIRADDTVWCWGRNREQQVIGAPTMGPALTPRRVCFPPN